ncbi:MAG: hypothetical protein WC758_01165 [Candidatus Woesearchaeota archaeon]|jgi:hypothetical protein
MDSNYKTKLIDAASNRAKIKKNNALTDIRDINTSKHNDLSIKKVLLFGTFYGCGFAKGFLDSTGIDIPKTSDNILLYGPTVTNGIRSLYDGILMAGELKAKRKHDSQLEQELKKINLTNNTTLKTTVGWTVLGTAIAASTTAIGYASGYGIGYILQKNT